MDLQKLAKINLVEELGVKNWPEKDQQNFLSKIEQRIRERIVFWLLDELEADEEKERFVSFLEESETKDNAEEFEQFLQEKIPNFKELITEEVGKFKREMMGMAKGTKE